MGPVTCGGCTLRRKTCYFLHLCTLILIVIHKEVFIRQFIVLLRHKMVCKRLFIFTFVSTIILTSCSLSAAVDSNVNLTIFVGKNGSDNASCGQQRSPCRTLQFAIKRVLEEKSTSAVINLFPGVYKPESIKIDCSTLELGMLVIQGFGNNSTEQVQVALSADVMKCNIVFNNIQWKSNSWTPVLINLLIANLSMINTAVMNLQFSIISMGSNVQLQDTLIMNCVGLQPLLPLVSASGLTGFDTNVSIRGSKFSSNKALLVSVKEVTALLVENSNFFFNNVSVDKVLILIDRAQTIIENSMFLKNRGTVLKMTHSTLASMKGSAFRNNDVKSGSLLDIGSQVVLHIVDCLFLSTYGILSGPVLRTEKGASAVDIQTSHFSCNKVNSTAHLSPIQTHTQNHVNCSNCTVNPHCSVYCPTGTFLRDSVMCSPCPVGTYSSGIVHNITTISCKKCSPGYYSSSPGSGTCKPCMKGTFAAKPGSTVCSPCTNDFMTSDEGEPSCSKMTIGCIVLTVCVILLILIPLLLLAWQNLYATTKNVSSRTKQTAFKRLSEDPPGSIIQ